MFLYQSKRKTKSAELDLERPCKEHSFITDVNDVRNMQEGLLKLLDDFDSGKVQAFGKKCSFTRISHSTWAGVDKALLPTVEKHASLLIHNNNKITR